ncbi:UNVERIFIED_ORG: sugar diacid utilization regulator/putative methionine-R-sulfoxide reductase with GAF domain [Heyndrickxia coagulans]
MMTIIEKIKRFFSESRHTPVQLWKNVNQDLFTLVFSQQFDRRVPAPHFLHNDQKTEYFSDYTDYHYRFHDKCTFVIRLLTGSTLTSSEEQYVETLLYAFGLEQILEQEKFIRQKMMESIREISVVNDLNTHSTKILENALSVIPAADFGVLWMYDETENALLPKAWAGGPSEQIQHMKMKVGEGIIGRTFRENKSQMYTNIDDIISASSSIAEENLHHLNRSYNFEYLQSVISVPINVAEKTMCVLIIYQNGKHPLLSSYDKQLLESFSDQVSIVLMNTRLFQDLKQQNQLLSQRDEIHQTFMKLSLQSKGIQNIANELRRMIHTSLVIVDFTDNQSYSCGNFWPSLSQIDQLNRAFSTIRSPIFHSFNDSGDCTTFYIQPIVAVDFCLGLIIVESDEHEFSPLSKMIIEQSSSVIALELIKKQTLADSFYKKTNDLFHDFLCCREYDLLRKKAIELGIHQHSFFLSTLIQLQPLADMQVMNLKMHRLVSDIKKKFQQKAPVVFGLNNKVTVLFQFEGATTQTYIVNQIQFFITNWSDSDNNFLRVGMGTCYSGLERIAKSYSEADKALSYLISRQKDGIMQYQDIGINRLFIHQSQEEIISFIDEVFHPLKSDHDKNNDLEKTLLVYMETNRSPAQTSKTLHIHVNTLYQRLKKIEEKLGISFSNTEHLLKLQLACYLRKSN